MSFPGSIAVFLNPDGSAADLAKELDRRCAGQLGRVSGTKVFKDLKGPAALVIPSPHGCNAESLIVAKLPADATELQLKQVGAEIAAQAGHQGLAVLASGVAGAELVALGASLGLYSFDVHRTKKEDGNRRGAGVTVFTDSPEVAADRFRYFSAIAEGVYLTRDLVNEPANILTTTEFARRIEQLREYGLSVKIMDEDELERLGMKALLAVGQGSKSPSRVAIMEWQGTEAERPLALIGKGVVFDTGGISIKPSAKMEEMTMDMAGAAVVVGVMKSLALRRSASHVVGIVGLVENMPGGAAQRPGDVVKTLKGDTVEVTNTDAEGRMVLADLLWHIQEEYNPTAMIDLATLTGAIIVALGDDLAGIFANDDEFVAAFLEAAAKEGEGAWRMPLHDPYNKMMKSRVADTQNVGGRAAGAVTAAQFLKRFVKQDCPWMHMDIAGVAYSQSRKGVASKWGTGWGVQSLNRLIAERYETD